MTSRNDTITKTTAAGVLAWIMPGAGHFYLGQRGLGLVLFATITFAYGTGLLVGGVKNSVNPRVNGWLFLAETGVGGYTALGYVVSQQLPDSEPDKPSVYVSYYPESDVAQIYLAIGGLLNLLAILDALMRAQTGGEPVFFMESEKEPEGAGEHQ